MAVLLWPAVNSRTRKKPRSELTEGMPIGGFYAVKSLCSSVELQGSLSPSYMSTLWVIEQIPVIPFSVLEHVLKCQGYWIRKIPSQFPRRAHSLWSEGAAENRAGKRAP